MRFRELSGDLSEQILQCKRGPDALSLFGVEYSMDRLELAKAAIRELRECGFSFAELFKYNDFHDDYDEHRTLLHVWKGKVHSGDFLATVRRAYFEFYARPEFVGTYRRLIEEGY